MVEENISQNKRGRSWCTARKGEEWIRRRCVEAASTLNTAWVHTVKTIGAVITPAMKENMKCPKCGKDTEWLRALSRVDNKTMICDECGTKEALDAAGLTEGSSVRKAIIACVGRGRTPQERVKAKVQATGNKWAMENFNDTHN